GAAAAADAEILNGLQIQSGAGDSTGLGADARDDLVGASFSLVARFELREQPRRAAAAAAAGERNYRFHSRILRNNVGKSAHLLRHGGKRKILIADDAAIDAPGVLLREETFGRLVKEVGIQANRADGDQQDQELVAKHPLQGEIVRPEKTVKSVFGKTVNSVVFARFMAEE